MHARTHTPQTRAHSLRSKLRSLVVIPHSHNVLCFYFLEQDLFQVSHSMKTFWGLFNSRTCMHNTRWSFYLWWWLFVQVFWGQRRSLNVKASYSMSLSLSPLRPQIDASTPQHTQSEQWEVKSTQLQQLSPDQPPPFTRPSPLHL